MLVSFSIVYTASVAALRTWGHSVSHGTHEQKFCAHALCGTWCCCVRGAVADATYAVLKLAISCSCSHTQKTHPTFEKETEYTAHYRRSSITYRSGTLLDPEGWWDRVFVVFTWRNVIEKCAMYEQPKCSSYSYDQPKCSSYSYDIIVVCGHILRKHTQLSRKDSIRSSV